MSLKSTNLTWNGLRVWLECASIGEVEHMEYVHGEVGRPAILKLENDPNGRRAIDDSGADEVSQGAGKAQESR